MDSLLFERGQVRKPARKLEAFFQINFHASFSLFFVNCGLKKQQKIVLDFIIDRLTNSIENTISGDSFQTEISRLTIADLKPVTKKNGWQFNWKVELADNAKEVYKLTIVNNPGIIQGLLGLSIRPDHILMNLVESAPFNIGKNKLYEGVAGNLVAYACKLSFQYGFEGFVSFTAKTSLIEHYEKTLGAYHFGGRRMIIPTEVAEKLIEKYFKN
jgi:hypothetical protein